MLLNVFIRPICIFLAQQYYRDLVKLVFLIKELHYVTNSLTMLFIVKLYLNV